MASTEIRAKEASVQLTMDGQRLGGSMLAIKNFSLKPDVELVKKMFIGDKRFRGDMNIKGYGFSFKIEKRDHIWWTVWKKFEAAEANGTAPPVVSIASTASYRGGATGVKTITLHGDLMMMMSGDETPEGYAEVSFEGICSYASGI